MNKILTTALLVLALNAGHAMAGVYDDILKATHMSDNTTVVDLLRRGMDINTSDEQGNTLLMIAVRTSNKELVKFLLENRANALKRNRYGDTALMLAALQGHVDIAEMMLERKVDPNQSGWAPLHYAAFENHARIIALLLTAGADINARAPNGWTALMLAAQRGHLESVRMLVGANADMKVSDVEHGDAKTIATTGKHDEVVRFLEQSQGKY